MPSFKESLCAQVSSTYHTIYELQYKLGIKDEYLLSTVREENLDTKYKQSLITLLDASRITRDKIIVWYLKHSKVELCVTISLLTAKIKFIEYKLGQCEGLDLHQACSLALVNFCNILSDMTVLNVEPANRKTMHTISKEVDMPIWLSHYRNQICHVPSESPCIAILVPLVIKSLSYIRESFWDKALKYDVFDAVRFKAVANYIIKHGKREKVEDDASKRKKRLALLREKRNKKACNYIRRFLALNRNSATELVASEFLERGSSKQEVGICGPLLEIVIAARCLEKLLYSLIRTISANPCREFLIKLGRLITLISETDTRKRKRLLTRLNISLNPKTQLFSDLPSLKCCQIAFQLIAIEHRLVHKFLIVMKTKLTSVIGPAKYKLLLQLTKIAKSLPPPPKGSQPSCRSLMIMS